MSLQIIIVVILFCLSMLVLHFLTLLCLRLYLIRKISSGIKPLLLYLSKMLFGVVLPFWLEYGMQLKENLAANCSICVLFLILMFKSVYILLFRLFHEGHWINLLIQRCPLVGWNQWQPHHPIHQIELFKC